MSGSLTLRLLTPYAAVEVGEPAQAAVTVAPDGRLEKARALRVTLRRRVHGAGDEERWEEEVFGLYADEQAAGTHAFSFTVPADGPCSHQGRYVKVSWELEASMDVPWARDPSARLQLLVVPRGSVATRGERAAAAG